MANDPASNEKLARLKVFANELASFVEGSINAPPEPQRRRFDCDDYTCHGHFTCSSFGCGSGFKLAD